MRLLVSCLLTPGYELTKITTNPAISPTGENNHAETVRADAFYAFSPTRPVINKLSG